MKSISFKTGMLAIVILFATVTNAQRGRTRTTPTTTRIPLKDTVPTINGLPVIIDLSVTIMDTVTSKSIKPRDTFGPGATSNRKPLPLEYLRWDDALYVQKVWRELDFREKINQSFRYDAMNDNGNQLFINILLKAVKAGQLQTFKDERFSIPITASQVTDMTSGKLDTVPRVNLITMMPDAYIVTRTSFDPKTVTKLLIMEEWIFDNKTSRMHCRIIGMAPLRTRYLPGGKQTEASSIMFWVNYADLRPILANAEVYNPKNMGQSRMTWEELFESRMFSSYITKSTIDNASNRTIRSYIKDPVLALLEGDNIKEKIFNYEQDLWSY